MHLSEFKAWFEGFTDGIDGIPSPKQWGKIKERVSQITNDYTPAPVFIRDYVRPYWPHWYETYTVYNGTSQMLAANLQANNAAAPSILDYTEHKTAAAPSQTDWRILGQAEFNAIGSA